MIGEVDIYTSLKSGPKFIHVLTKPFNADVKNIPLNPIQIKNRFMEFIQENARAK